MSIETERTVPNADSVFTSTQIFADRVAIVTGGGAGIGEETAHLLASAGAKCVIADVNAASAAEVAEAITTGGGTALARTTDVTSEQAIHELVTTTVERWGRLDVVINNAGGVAGPDRHGTKIIDLSPAAWDATVALNLRSVFLSLKYSIRAMLELGSGGSIVNLASLAGLIGDNTTTAAYGTAKAGVIHLTRVAAVEYAAAGVRINSVSPGSTVHRQNRAVAQEGLKMTLARRDELTRKYHPMGRMMEASELARAIAFLASDASSGITGINLPVDGGWSAR